MARAGGGGGFGFNSAESAEEERFRVCGSGAVAELSVHEHHASDRARSVLF